MKCATAEATRDFAKSFANNSDSSYRDAQGLILASIGIGTYLGKWDAETDKNYIASVIEYVKKGGNVIDTAGSYRFQRSEKNVGEALALLKTFDRTQLFICTKGGFLAFEGEPPENVEQFFDEKFVRTGIANSNDLVGGSHIIAPGYIESQVYQSLKNLSVEAIDLYYLHNPETQLKAIDRVTFELRVAKAFEKLEELRAAGKLHFYGVSTWEGFRVLPDAEKYHSLERFVQIAKQIGGDDHGFRFIQLPFNLAMPEAYLIRNQAVNGKTYTCLRAAIELDLSVMVSAPILQGKLAHSVPLHVRETLGNLTTDAQTSIQFARSASGVTSALVGMSSVGHVDENMLLMKDERSSGAEFESLFEG